MLHRMIARIRAASCMPFRLRGRISPGSQRTRRRVRAGLSRYLKKLTSSRRPTGHLSGIQRLTTPHAALRVDAVAGPGVACGTATERRESVSTSASIHLTKKGAAMKLVSHVVVVLAALALSACGSVQSSGTDASGRGGGGGSSGGRRQAGGGSAGTSGRWNRRLGGPAAGTADVAARAERAVRAAGRGGTGATGTAGTCGGQVCTVQEICCGPAECPRCMNIPSTLCPTTCGGTGGGSAGRGGGGRDRPAAARGGSPDAAARRIGRPRRHRRRHGGDGWPQVVSRRRRLPGIQVLRRFLRQRRQRHPQLRKLRQHLRGAQPLLRERHVPGGWPCTLDGVGVQPGLDLLRGRVLHRHADLLHGDARPDRSPGASSPSTGRARPAARDAIAPRRRRRSRRQSAIGRLLI